MKKPSKILAKRGNIAAQTLCFLSMFACLPTTGNIVVEQCLLPGSKNVSQEIQKHFGGKEALFSYVS